MKHLMYLFAMLLLAACINNDERYIPYPTLDGSITGIEVEGQTTPATIDKEARTVDVYVNDQVRVSRLLVKRLTVTNNATVTPLDSMACLDYKRFPRKGFEDIDSLPLSANTAIDFTNPIRFRLSTYQDYDWKVTVHQVIERNVQVADQVGKAVIDDVNRNVVIYVATGTDLKRIKVHAFSLGGEHGHVTPDPTEYTYFDFSQPCKFFVTQGWEELSQEWTVRVYYRDVEDAETNVSAFAMTTRAYITGTVAQSSADLMVEYRMLDNAEWRSATDVNRSGTDYEAVLTNLSPSTAYAYRIVSGGKVGEENTFTTAPAPVLTDGSFDNWHAQDLPGAGNRQLWNPWAEGQSSFWDTGNRGATTVGASNSIPTSETCNGSGQAALLQSKYIVLRFAAGNIFTGQYVETDGANGVLDFGRPFNGFPTKLRVNYKCTVGIVNRCGDSDYEYLRGRPDSCQIYIALADWDEPLRIRTRPSTRNLFNPNDAHIIAYSQITVGKDVPEWTQQDLVLDYRYKNRTPKYILIVASASKYGDFFTGGEGSQLWIDNFELIYD